MSRPRQVLSGLSANKAKVPSALGSTTGSSRRSQRHLGPARNGTELNRPFDVKRHSKHSGRDGSSEGRPREPSAEASDPAEHGRPVGASLPEQSDGQRLGGGKFRLFRAIRAGED